MFYGVSHKKKKNICIFILIIYVSMYPQVKKELLHDWQLY